MPLVLVHDLVDNKYVQGPEAVVSNINHKIDTIGDSNNKENVESGVRTIVLMYFYELY